MRWRSQGVTLLEILVVLAVASLLLTIALPSFQHTIAGGERTASVNALLTSLHLARRIALDRANVVVLCKAPGGDECARGDDVAWSDGIVVFVNLDEDDPPRIDAGEPVIHRQALAGAVRVFANRESFAMRPYGRRSTNGTFTVCDRRGEPHARAVIVSWTGRPRVASTLPDGEALTCASS